MRERANQARAVIRIPTTRPEDRSLLLKCCALVEKGRLPESWLADSLGSVTALNGSSDGIANKWGYLYRSFANNAAEQYQERLEPLLASIDVPEHLLSPPKSTPSLQPVEV